MILEHMYMFMLVDADSNMMSVELYITLTSDHSLVPCSIMYLIGRAHMSLLVVVAMVSAVLYYRVYSVYTVDNGCGIEQIYFTISLKFTRVFLIYPKERCRKV